MKNILKILSFILLSMLIATGCDPQYDSDSDLGAEPTEKDISFSAKVSDENPNIIEFVNTSPRSGVALWDLGNGVNTKGDKAKGIYPNKGDYTVTMTLYTTGGAISLEQVVNIAEDNLSMLDTEVYRNLTGGGSNLAGKVWVIDRYNNFAEEVKQAMGTDIKGHMGLGPVGNYDQEWWGADPNAKKDWTLYDHKFTFKQEGLSLNVQNKGEGYGRKASSASVGGFTVKTIDGDDATFDYSGGDYTFSIDESGKYPVLSLSGRGFLGYYCGTQDYEIFYQTDKVMALRVNNTVEGQDWIFIYCLEELNIEPPAPEIPLKAVELKADFETTPTFEFVGEDMGSLFSLSYQNPAPVPINQSGKVALYEKSNAFYSNLSFTAKGYKFDLTEQNKIKMKVFIPGYNDYDKENDVAGDWITNKKLLSQVAVKLQDSSKGGNAWENQTEIVKANLEKNKWIELVFDFSTVKGRTDYDKIVIQFGAEGHSGNGIFYFDDFSFTK